MGITTDADHTTAGEISGGTASSCVMALIHEKSGLSKILDLVDVPQRACLMRVLEQLRPDPRPLHQRALAVCGAAPEYPGGKDQTSVKDADDMEMPLTDCGSICSASERSLQSDEIATHSGASRSDSDHDCKPVAGQALFASDPDVRVRAQPQGPHEAAIEVLRSEALTLRGEISAFCTRLAGAKFDVDLSCNGGNLHSLSTEMDTAASELERLAAALEARRTAKIRAAKLELENMPAFDSLAIDGAESACTQTSAPAMRASSAAGNHQLGSSLLVDRCEHERAHRPQMADLT